MEMKTEKSIKKKEAMREGDQEFVRESTVVAWTISVTIFNQYILEQTYLDCAEDKFT